MTSIRITWDDVKAVENLAKHHVSFEEAATVVRSMLTAWFVDGGKGEERRIGIGYSNQGRVLFVVTVEIHEDHQHIISARKATSHERKAYQKRPRR